MHVLIIGAAGMIGRKLAGRMAADGALSGQPIDKLTLADIFPPSAPVGSGEVYFMQPSRHDSFSRRQRSEQYLTSSQFFAHFRRQANGRPHVAHGFVGKSPFLTIFGTPILLQLHRRSPAITRARLHPVSPETMKRCRGNPAFCVHPCAARMHTSGRAGDFSTAPRHFDPENPNRER